jgi:hypothetical protein
MNDRVQPERGDFDHGAGQEKFQKTDAFLGGTTRSGRESLSQWPA